MQATLKQFSEYIAPPPPPIVIPPAYCYQYETNNGIPITNQHGIPLTPTRGPEYPRYDMPPAPKWKPTTKQLHKDLPTITHLKLVTIFTITSIGLKICSENTHQQTKTTDSTCQKQ